MHLEFSFHFTVHDESLGCFGQPTLDAEEYTYLLNSPEDAARFIERLDPQSNDDFIRRLAFDIRTKWTKLVDMALQERKVVDQIAHRSNENPADQ